MDTPKPPIAIVSLEWDIVALIESIDVHRILGFFDASPACDARDFRFFVGIWFLCGDKSETEVIGGS